MWPIGTRSGLYTIWLYAHNVSADSLFQALNDLLLPKLLAEESGLTQRRQEAGTSPTAAQRRWSAGRPHPGWTGRCPSLHRYS